MDDASARHLRWVVRLAVVLLTAGMATAATLYPTYRAPDEPAHVDQVRAVRDTWRQPAVGERMLSAQVVGSYDLVGYLSGVPGEAPPLAADDAPARATRPTFADIAPDAPSALLNQMPQHPPLYYWLGAGWSAVGAALVPGVAAFDVEVLLLRLLGVLLVAPVPWLAARTARHLSASPTMAATAAILTLGVPMLVHIGASVNNDVLLILLGSVATVQAAAVARGDLGVRRAVVLGGTVGLALLTKAFGFALLPLVVAAYAVAMWRGRDRAATGLRRGAVSLVVAAAVGGWWWVRNVLVSGSIQPGGAPSPDPPAGFAPDLGWWAPFFVARMVRRWWIEPDTVSRTTPALIIIATVVLGGLIVVAVVRGGPMGRRDVLVVVTPVVASLALVVFAAWRVYARTGIPFAIHGRYLYPGIAGVAVAAAGGTTTLVRRGAPALALAVAAVMQLVAGWWALTSFWGIGGRGAPLASLRSWLAWSPIPPTATLAPVAVAIAVGVTLAILVRPVDRSTP